MAQMVENLPAVQETRIRSLGQEDPLEKGMATHLSIFAWRIPWTEEPGRLQSVGLQKLGGDSVTNAFTIIYVSVYLSMILSNNQFTYICMYLVAIMGEC